LPHLTFVGVLLVYFGVGWKLNRHGGYTVGATSLYGCPTGRFACSPHLCARYPSIFCLVVVIVNILHSTYFDLI
jgi:hypothetical protein